MILLSCSGPGLSSVPQQPTTAYNGLDVHTNPERARSGQQIDQLGRSLFGKCRPYVSAQLKRTRQVEMDCADHTWSLWLWGTRKSRQTEPQPTTAPPPEGYNTNATRPLTFGEKFRRYIADLLKLQRERILRENRRRGWTGDYPDGGTRMYLLGSDRVYLVQVVAGCVWVPEEMMWAPEVFIVGEGIHLIVDDPMRLMAQPNRANIIAAELGMKTYER